VQRNKSDTKGGWWALTKKINWWQENVRREGLRGGRGLARVWNNIPYSGYGIPWVYIYATIDNTYISHPHVHIHHMCPQVHTHYKSIETSPQIHKLSQSNETSSEHDQLSPRAYSECSCGGKGGTGDWRTCSPLGAC
jgi:hypothetical protein